MVSGLHSLMGINQDSAASAPYVHAAPADARNSTDRNIFDNGTRTVDTVPGRYSRRPPVDRLSAS